MIVSFATRASLYLETLNHHSLTHCIWRSERNFTSDSNIFQCVVVVVDMFVDVS